MLPFELPADLREFLAAGKSLEYDPTTCEAGAVTLLRLDELKVELFPTAPNVIEQVFHSFNPGDPGTPDRDPNFGGEGYYLVAGVSLVRDCRLRDPCGLLLWLPLENQYATWDGDALSMAAFPPSHRWTDIVKSPSLYLSAHWSDVAPGLVPALPFKPWPRHRYAKAMGSGPFPYTAPNEPLPTRDDSKLTPAGCVVTLLSVVVMLATVYPIVRWRDSDGRPLPNFIPIFIPVVVGAIFHAVVSFVLKRVGLPVWAKRRTAPGEIDIRLPD